MWEFVNSNPRPSLTIPNILPPMQHRPHLWPLNLTTTIRLSPFQVLYVRILNKCGLRHNHIDKVAHNWNFWYGRLLVVTHSFRWGVVNRWRGLTCCKRTALARLEYMQTGVQKRLYISFLQTIFWIACISAICFWSAWTFFWSLWIMVLSSITSLMIGLFLTLLARVANFNVEIVSSLKYYRTKEKPSLDKKH